MALINHTKRQDQFKSSTDVKPGNLKGPNTFYQHQLNFIS